MSSIETPSAHSAAENISPADVIKTFYLTFAVSQGNAETQQKIGFLSAMYYQTNHGFDQVNETVNAIPDEKIGNLRLPGYHLKPTDKNKTEQENVRDEFKRQWDYFRSEFTSERPIYNPASKATQSRLVSLVKDLVLLDNKFLSDPLYIGGKDILITNERSRGIEKHAERRKKSYVRDHVLGGLSIGDPAVIDRILADSREILIGSRDLSPLSSLRMRQVRRYAKQVVADKWEKRNPGEKFVDVRRHTPNKTVESYNKSDVS